MSTTQEAKGAYNNDDEISVSIYVRGLDKHANISHDKEIELFERLETKVNTLKDELVDFGIAAPFFKELVFRVLNGGERRERFFGNENMDEIRAAINDAINLHSKANKAFAEKDTKTLDELLTNMRKKYEVAKIRQEAVVALGEKLLAFREQVLREPYKREIYEGDLWMDIAKFEKKAMAVKQYLADIKNVKNFIVESNLRLVFSMAKKAVTKNVQLADLIQEGNIGLLKAVDRFDYSLGYKFSTYATWWIRQGLNRAIRNSNQTIHIPVHVATDISTLNKAKNRLVQLNGEEPTIEQLSNVTKMSVERIKELREYAKSTVSLDQQYGDAGDKNNTMLDFVPDFNTKDPSEEAGYRLMRSRIYDIIEVLTPRERDVIQRRFGLDDGHVQTLEEIGKSYSITREAVRLIEVKALRKMRGASAVTLSNYV